MNNTNYIKLMSTKYIICIMYDFVVNIKIYFLLTYYIKHPF